MEGMIGEFRATAESIFLGGNWIFMGMVIVAALVGVAAMKNVGQIICVSVLALIVFGLLWLVYGGATGAAPTDPGAYLGQLEAGWATLGAMSGSTMISYLVVFAVTIAVLFIGKSLFFRG
ncbi:MAG: hypothetical protein AAFW81_06645 [Pseudomonadota bacterium]